MATPITTIYAGGPLYLKSSSSISDLQASGFTTVMGWALHVSQNGDLSFNDSLIVRNGQYVGDSDWPAALASLKQGTTSITQLGFSIGGGGVGDFNNIKNLVASQGTGSDSILYKNFSALTQAISALNLIDLDDESTYDKASTVAFCQMLYGELGLSITFCPFTDSSYWVDLYTTLNDYAAGVVLGFNLQCYAGGGGNDPADWIQALNQATGLATGADLVWPGLWCIHTKQCNAGDSPSAMQTQFSTWQSNDSIVGGFVWLYDDILHCQQSTQYGASDYASALKAGLGG